MKRIKRGVTNSRSRKGAWIEIALNATNQGSVHSRSRKGAWIEIQSGQKAIAPARSRSRKGAWIEIALTGHWSAKQNVAPVRERGLKCRFQLLRFHVLRSLP